MLVLHAHNASDWTGPSGNNTYFLPGSRPTLVDAGVGHAEHLANIERALNGSALASVLITHGHPDHIAGVPALIGRWPDLRVSKMAPDLPDGASALADGERVAAGDRSLTVMSTPGHSLDHCCFFDEQDGGLYCGDLVRAGGTIVISPAYGGDLGEYLRSLQRVRELKPKRLLPGHGPIIDDPEAIIDAYLRHRAERESQVIDWLRNGASNPEQLVAVIYPGLAQPLVPAAAEMMRAHLEKLSKEGRVRQEDGRWTLTSR